MAKKKAKKAKKKAKKPKNKLPKIECSKCGCEEHSVKYVSKKALGFECCDPCPDGDHFHFDCALCGRRTWFYCLDHVPEEPKPSQGWVGYEGEKLVPAEEWEQYKEQRNKWWWRRIWEWFTKQRANE